MGNSIKYQKIGYWIQQKEEERKITVLFDEAYQKMLLYAQHEQSDAIRHVRVIAYRYIPCLWKNRVNRLHALGKKLDEHERRKIRAQLDPDCENLNWNQQYLDNCLPKEAKDPVHQANANKRWEKHRLAQETYAKTPTLQPIMDKWTELIMRKGERSIWFTYEGKEVGLKIDLINWRVIEVLSKQQQTLEELERLQAYD